MAVKKTSTSKQITNQIKKLLQLQEISQNLDLLVKEIDQLKEEAEQEEKKLATKEYQHEKHLPYFQKVEKEYNLLQTELDDIKKEIEAKEETKKKIKTIKEFKAINKEIDFLNRENAIKENDLLTKEEELEFKKSKIEKISTGIEEIKEVIKEKKKDLETLIKERKNSIAKFTKEKKGVESSLPALLVKAFNRIYKTQYRLAVVTIEKQICGGCHMKIPQQFEINVKKEEEIIFCPSCSRVLYVDKEVA